MKVGTFSDYKNFLGSIEYNEESNMYRGCLINVNGLINYQAYTLDDLYYEFKCAVDDYLEFLKEINRKV